MDFPLIAKIGKALSDPTRLRIYQRIAAQGECFCGELVEMEDLTPGTISHHLKTLAEAGLIESRREGQFVYSRALPGSIKKYTEAIRELGPPKKAGERRSVR